MTTNSITNQKTIQQIIDSSSESSKNRKTGELGKDEFLNLLITQLRYQDPLKPVDDKEFIGQMAQFSALEQMQNMNKSISQSQAYSLIGKRISANIVDEKTSTLDFVEGNVTGVKFVSGKTFVVVRGVDIPIEDVTNVSETNDSSSANLALYMSLIGTNVKGCIYNPNTGDIIEVSGLIKSIQKGLYEDYALVDGMQLDMSDIITDKPSTDPDFKKNYLENNIGKEVAIEIVDKNTGKKVPINAILRDYTISTNSEVSVLLDNVPVPVESISNVRFAE